MDTNVYRRLRLAAAIAYHLPGASVTLRTETAIRIVAPLGLSESDLHPAEFRELVIASGVTHDLRDLTNGLDLDDLAMLSIEIVSGSSHLRDIGGGIYEVSRINGDVAHVFASTLHPDEVAEAMLSAQTARESGPISAHLFYDDDLEVTLAFFAGEGSEAHQDRIRAATASVAVVEDLTGLMPA